MGNKMRNFFSGRSGPDALSKTELFLGVVFMPAAYLLTGRLGNYPTLFLQLASLILVTMSLLRVMSRNILLRQKQNAKFTGFFSRIRDSFRRRREHFGQRRDWRFFRCPHCGAWLRVPRGRGRVHINCKCGYVLYRKT